jgi:DNA-binding transcriptional MerR regulator
MDEGLTIQEAAERVGLSIDTLRYYERAGLLPHVVRTTGGQRRYDSTNLGGIQFVTKMRATGMPVRQIREYMQTPVREDGRSPERRAILEEHRRSVLQKLHELQDALVLIERKIEMYDANGLSCAPVIEPTRDHRLERIGSK